MRRQYEGDPKLYLTPDGADIRYKNGQPDMENGVENQILISLFTREGWCGNIFLPSERQIGSNFEETCAGSITRSKLTDIENAAADALSGKAFSRASATASNPKGDRLSVGISVRGAAVSLIKEGAVWKNQREQA